MGLDCVPLGVAKPGHEAEWRRIMESIYADGTLAEALRGRLLDISVNAFEVLGAPTVGTDPEADTWVLERKPEDSEHTDDEFLREMQGYRVLDLVPESCAGLPQYTNGGLYDGIDQTSFRGAFLQSCEDIIGAKLLERAWTDVMRPEEAIEYGNALLDAAARTRAVGGNTEPAPDEARGMLSRLLGRARRRSRDDDLPLEEKLHILASAGNWYRFWGERGHPIWAFY